MPSLETAGNWLAEKRSAYLYRAIADAERGTPRRALFLELAREAERQAELWVRKAEKTGGGIPQGYRPDLRARLVARLIARFGAGPLRTVLAAMKIRGMVLYASGRLPPGSPGAETRRHRGLAGGGNLRAAVFGVNDGLVSNAGLILGVAGAGPEPGVILLSGIAGLLAGAFSMAAGEYVSVRSQRELYERQIALEREELEQYPEEEAEELALIYAARGLPEDEARRLARRIITDPEQALDTLAREELGLNPESLGSPWGAALFSFGAFAAGALVPLLPLLFAGGATALAGSMTISAAALFGVGAILSLFTGKSAWLGGLRMLAIGAAAGGLTYWIGKALGAALGA